MRVPLALLADYANVTSDGKLNIMGTFNTIRAVGFPSTHPQMRLITVMETDPAERGTTKTIEIVLLDADGNKLLQIGGSLQVAADAPLAQRFNQIVELTGVQFPRPGAYSFRISVNGEEKTSIDLKLEQIPAQSGQGASAT